MRYYGDVYRPPSEANSFILQVTLGCSHNACAFCSMYKEKSFTVRPWEEVLADLTEVSREYPYVRRVFLADGDALAVPADYLLELIKTIWVLFPSCERITSYASPGSILRKTKEELSLIRNAGLSMLYMGLESGNNEVLKKMRKGYTAEEIVSAGRKAKDAGFALSVTAISGLGGKERTKEHAWDTGKALSAMNPDYIGLLTLMVNQRTPLYEWIRSGSFELLSPDEVLEETRTLLENLDSPGSIFRMNHASNYLILKGTFNQDKERLLAQIEAALEGKAFLRSEAARRL